MPVAGSTGPVAVVVLAVTTGGADSSAFTDSCTAGSPCNLSHESHAAATEDDVLHVWQGLGYYSRARNLHRAAQAIHAQYGGRPPDAPALLAALPGVGRYTAGAIATFAFDRAVPIIDANIARVIARLLDLQEPIDSARGGEILWDTATMLLPKDRGRLHNSALMELGALVCTPRNPS